MVGAIRELPIIFKEDFKMTEVKIGVIGGSGLYQMEGLAIIEERSVSTPFGEPSDSIIIGNMEGVNIGFLPRHRRGHTIMPTEINYRANIYALKRLGVEWIIAISAVGSLREDIKPLDIVIPDQVIDRTRNRVSTFFGQGIVAHVGFADPYCPVLSKVLYETGIELGYSIHQNGTYICMEGPQFSTRAESKLYRSWGADIIGMTTIPEAKLAREAEICYATIALATDYDVWRESEEDVTTEMILNNLMKNVTKAKSMLKSAIIKIPNTRDCVCKTALKNAIATELNMMPKETKQRLSALLQR